MYCQAELGRFFSPPPDQWRANPEHGVLDVQYQPETPVAVRGAMDPWALERQRELFAAEEIAWKSIQAEQVYYRRLLAESVRKIAEFNQKVRELEQLTGKPSGMLSANNIASFIAGAGGNPYIMAALAIKQVVEIVLGSLKKKKINAKIREIERLQAEIRAIYAKMVAIQDRVEKLIQTGEQVRMAQQIKIDAALQQSATAYASRQLLDAQRGAALAERNRQVALLFPSRPGGSDAL